LQRRGDADKNRACWWTFLTRRRAALLLGWNGPGSTRTRRLSTHGTRCRGTNARGAASMDINTPYLTAVDKHALDIRRWRTLAVTPPDSHHMADGFCVVWEGSFYYPTGKWRVASARRLCRHISWRNFSPALISCMQISRTTRSSSRAHAWIGTHWGPHDARRHRHSAGG